MLSAVRIARVCLHLGFAFAAGTLALKHFCPIERAEVDLAPGECADVDGDVLALKDFQVPKYPSGAPRQYVASAHLISGMRADGGAAARHAEISVNHPLRHRGWWIYQSSYDAATERRTVLLFVRDPYLPLAALGGVLLLVGAFLLCLTPAGASAAASGGGLPRAARVLLGVALTMLPLFIVGRALLTRELLPALQSPFLVPHVGAYLVAYAFLFCAAFGAGVRFVPFAFFLLTLGLTLGALWGKICWGDWWQYDPKEMWSLATWLVYVAYFHFRGRPRAAKALLVAGAVMVVLTLTWVNFSRLFTGLHSYAS